MASITIRNLEEELKTNLRIIAAQHGHSMEEEVRCILRQVIGQHAPVEKGFGSKLKAKFEDAAADSFNLPERQPPRMTRFE
ncbi:MAG: plasmid stabilization protein [Thiomicrospira sp.]|uniref:FitA-like ribbon-helix-helix domain-containing protein n=1 Tax=Thiomicrospira sp. TaxID=935 RepID=UPI0019EDB843|nr:plasmid stabilization protein [Thiomicrospira sp.]MBE0493596.1 plasmid stabilization protein [Thiomicrospira sp.]